MYPNYFQEQLLCVNSVAIYNNGIKIEYDCSDCEFVEIIDLLNELFDNCREMPAFGVALNDEVNKEKTNGVWLELEFQKTYYHNDMPYDTLLFQINPEFTGFNIIRGNDGNYEGRCFYVDLINKTMRGIYNVLRKI